MFKILFLIKTLNGGGAEKVLVDLVNALPSNQYDVTVQTILDTGLYKEKLNSSIRYKTIIRPKSNLLDLVRLKILYKVLRPKTIYNRYIADNYDIEVAFLEGMPTRIIANSTNSNSKKYAWVHTDLMQYFNSNYDYGSFEENYKCYEKYNKIACVSESVKQEFQRRFAGIKVNVETVYNVINDKDIIAKGNDEEIEFRHDYPIIMGCGRFCEQKAFDRLLRIHKRLIDEKIAHYLWLVGDGALRGQYEEFIVNQGINDTTTIWGYQKNPYKFIRSADIFVCSSIAEGYSTVVTEAVLLGVPVISTDVAGSKEPFENPRCYLVTPNTEDDLYCGIKRLLVDAEEYLQAKEYTSNIYKCFSLKQSMSRVLAFLED